MTDIRVLVVGLGNMGLSHARAYKAIDGFEIQATTGGYLGTDAFLTFIRNAEAGIKEQGLFEGRGPIAILLLVLIGGLALNLTPCVLPMIPINIAIIGAGAQAGSKSRGFLLGSAYGGAMALVYGAIGLVVVLTAGSFGTINASPWFNLSIAVLGVVLGLAMVDVIKSDIHSTDTHGYSEVIFASTYLLGFEFAPRIKGVGRQQLYAFKHRKHYEEQGYLLLPDHYIRENQFEDQWDDVLRFIATIRLKVTTASQLFKRLNSYSKQHPLYRALKEFGKIPKSLFILKYCDILEFRQAIEKQLNKIESSNKFSKAVSFGHSSEFMQSEKEDQEIAEACRRLIKNAAVCWNYLYLSQELATEKNDKRRAELIEAIRNGSVATWKHFNLHGEFDFSDERMVDSMGLAVPKNPDWKSD
jgi:hypothetical protein